MNLTVFILFRLVSHPLTNRRLYSDLEEKTLPGLPF